MSNFLLDGALRLPVFYSQQYDKSQTMETSGHSIPAFAANERAPLSLYFDVWVIKRMAASENLEANTDAGISLNGHLLFSHLPSGRGLTYRTKTKATFPDKNSPLTSVNSDSSSPDKQPEPHKIVTRVLPRAPCSMND